MRSHFNYIFGLCGLLMGVHVVSAFHHSAIFKQCVGRQNGALQHAKKGGEVTDWSTATKGMSQKDLMIKDECLVVNEDDEICGTASKWQAHRFTPTKPGGILHRAFSIFLFDENDKLLLQQRASHKITFPDVWTNTCCSHPLSGYEPNEVDDKDSVRTGKVMGIKAAAQRKLEHELGIDSRGNIPLDKIRYLGRIHYSAPCALVDGELDTDSAGQEDGGHWGESEIDYILFARVNREKLCLACNPEEVRDYRFVSEKELKGMMADPALKWSPWFRLLASSLLPVWWADLDRAIETEDFVDVNTIHRYEI